MLYSSYADLIGETPLVRLGRLDLPEGATLWAKLELANPGGSVKDRIGRAMIDDKFSGEKVALLRALGAEIVRTPRSGGMLLAERRADEIAAATPGAVVLGQFRNPANPRAHYETTGPEIWRDLGGRVDAFVAGAGSGGTFSGVARYLKERNPALRAVLADPVGSTMGGGEHADYDIEGIGNDFVAETMDMALVDEVVKVADEEAFDGRAPAPAPRLPPRCARSARDCAATSSSSSPIAATATSARASSPRTERLPCPPFPPLPPPPRSVPIRRESTPGHSSSSPDSFPSTPPRAKSRTTRRRRPSAPSPTSAPSSPPPASGLSTSPRPRSFCPISPISRQ